MSEVLRREPPAHDAKLAERLVEAKVEGFRQRVRDLQREKQRIRDGDTTRLGKSVKKLEAKKWQQEEAAGTCRDLSKINAQGIFEYEKQAIQEQYAEALEMLRDNIREEINAEIGKLERNVDEADEQKQRATRSLRSNTKDSDAERTSSSSRKRAKNSVNGNNVLDRTLDDAEIDCDLQDMTESNTSALLRLVQEETAFAGAVTGAPLGAAALHAIREADKANGRAEKEGVQLPGLRGQRVCRVFKGQLLYFRGDEVHEKFDKGDVIQVYKAADPTGAAEFVGTIISVNLLGILIEDEKDDDSTMHVSVDDLRSKIYRLERKPSSDSEDD
mmetsp:Transcript_6555/g.18569  ORF Transcript_6555/g.18569 Transcript_6555/m.18569 type:complete len:330 (-) Transcript_6555:49-1038(-)